MTTIPSPTYQYTDDDLILEVVYWERIARKIAVVMSRDLRRYARQTNIRLVAGVLLITFLVGDGLIHIFYGRGAAVFGLVCLLAALFPVVLIAAALWLMDWVVKKADPD